MKVTEHANSTVHMLNLAAAGGLAPPFTGSKPVVLLLDDTATKWSGRRGSHPRSLAPEASVLAATLHPDGAGKVEVTRLRPFGRASLSPRQSKPSALAKEVVVSPGVAPGPPACRAGVVTGSLADEIGCQGRIRTYILPLNRRTLDY